MQNRNKRVSHEGLFSVRKELTLTQNLGSWLTLVLLQPWPCPHLRLCESQCNRSTQQRPHTFLKHCEDLPASESRNGGVQHSSLKSLLPRPPNHPQAGQVLWLLKHPQMDHQGSVCKKGETKRTTSTWSRGHSKGKSQQAGQSPSGQMVALFWDQRQESAK